MHRDRKERCSMIDDGDENERDNMRFCLFLFAFLFLTPPQPRPTHATQPCSLAACGILVSDRDWTPSPDSERPPESPNHWTASEFPVNFIFREEFYVGSEMEGTETSHGFCVPALAIGWSYYYCPSPGFEVVYLLQLLKLHRHILVNDSESTLRLLLVLYILWVWINAAWGVSLW